MCLPYEAFLSLDAIATSVGRVVFTKRKLLEWQTAGDSERTDHSNLTGIVRAMWMGPIVALSTLLVLSIARPALSILECQFFYLVFEPRCCVVAESAHSVSPIAIEEGRPYFPTDDCTPNMEVFRNLCGTGRPLASTRQLPGGPCFCSRPSYFANEYRTLSAHKSCRCMTSGTLYPTTPRSNFENVCNHGKVGALSWTFL